MCVIPLLSVSMITAGEAHKQASAPSTEVDFLPCWNPKHRCQHHIDQRVISCCLISRSTLQQHVHSDTVRVLAIRTLNSFTM